MPKGIMLTPEQQEERREEIISVAMQLIEKNGFQKTSMRLLQVRRNSFLSPSLDISIMIYQIFLLKFLVTLVLVLLHKKVIYHSLNLPFCIFLRKIIP